MFTRQKTEDQNLQTIENIVRTKLTDDSVTPEEFAQILAEYTKFENQQHATKRDSRVSADVLATIAANLVGIIVIVKHEQANVIASKALGFVQKLR